MTRAMSGVSRRRANLRSTEPLSLAAEQEILEHGLIKQAVIDAERQAVLELRERGEIGDEAWRRVERDLDLEELRLEA